MGLLFPSPPRLASPGRPLPSLAGAVLLHAALIALVAVVAPVEEIRRSLAPMAVRMIEAIPELPRPPTPTPPPKKAPPRAVPEPLLTTQAPAESPAAFAVAPAPTPVAAAPAPVAAAIVAPVAVVGPRFDADYLDNPKPVYPHASRRLGEQGKVLLRVLVSAAGLAEKVEVKATSGFTRLDQAAQDAVGRWRFVPARRGAEAVAAWVQVPITFQMEG